MRLGFRRLKTAINDEPVVNFATWLQSFQELYIRSKSAAIAEDHVQVTFDFARVLVWGIFFKFVREAGTHQKAHAVVLHMPCTLRHLLEGVLDKMHVTIEQDNVVRLQSLLD